MSASKTRSSRKKHEHHEKLKTEWCVYYLHAIAQPCLLVECLIKLHSAIGGIEPISSIRSVLHEEMRLLICSWSLIVFEGFDGFEGV